MISYIRGYKDDAGVDIVFDDVVIIRPGMNTIELNHEYTPAIGEVALLVSRGSTAAKGIFPIPVAIDAGYEGKITAWVYNASGRSHVFDKGDRAFSIINIKLGEDRVEYKVSKDGKRGKQKLNSSGGNV